MNSVRIGFRWIVDGLLMESYGFLWISKDFDGFLWISMDFDGFRWIFYGFLDEILCIIDGILWILMDT